MSRHTPETLAAYLATLPNPKNKPWDLRWFFAYRNAEAFMDCGTKDLARSLLEGIGPVDVQEEIDVWYEDEPDNEEMVTSCLEEAVRDFFDPQ